MSISIDTSMTQNNNPLVSSDSWDLFSMSVMVHPVDTWISVDASIPPVYVPEVCKTHQNIYSELVKYPNVMFRGGSGVYILYNDNLMIVSQSMIVILDGRKLALDIRPAVIYQYDYAHVMDALIAAHLHQKMTQLVMSSTLFTQRNV